MKRAVILHGTDGAPDHNWFPWLKTWLEAHDYKVWLPELPGNHTPDRHVYNDFLLDSNWDFSDNLVIGHSSGAVSVLNLLQDKRCPQIKVGVLVGAWSHMEQTDLDREQFKNLFPESFDFDAIRRKTDSLLFMHGDNDPFCPLDQAKWLAQQTDSEIVIVPGGHHLGSIFTEFPQLTQELESRNLV